MIKISNSIGFLILTNTNMKLTIIAIKKLVKGPAKETKIVSLFYF